MRTNCPICNHEAIDQFEMNYIVPDGWTLPDKYIWKLCKCGFIWADTNGTEEDLDNYYREHYSQPIDIHDTMRLRNLASYIFETIAPHTKIVDFGGGNGELEGYLKEYGFENVTTVNLDNEMPECDLVILSQVIEHLYDFQVALDYIEDSLYENGIVIIETPDAERYSKRTWPKMFDYMPTHINHFSIKNLQSLMTLRGYTTINIYLYEFKPTNAPMTRMTFLMGENKQMFDRVSTRIINIAQVRIDEPVIVYGLGDMAMHTLAKSNLDVKSYVDDSPSYKGATINGIPVLDHIEGDYPIVIIGQRQRQAILDKLKGVKNKVIEI